VRARLVLASCDGSADEREYAGLVTFLPMAKLAREIRARATSDEIHTHGASAGSAAETQGRREARAALFRRRFAPVAILQRAELQLVEGHMHTREVAASDDTSSG
jgi:hypothetical protein